MNIKLKQSDFPTFEGSTGGWLTSAKTEEKYVIIWKSNDNFYFELPTGGTAIMNKGNNIAYFNRKEQCLALGSLLRGFKINNYKIFRIYPPLDISLLHPFDGVFPEKVNEGRSPVGKRDNSIGGNPNPASLKFTGTSTYNVYR
jgi:photosystem I subunit 2